MELLERSGVPEMLESWMPRTGRPRELSPREILFGMLVAIDEDRVAHLSAGLEALLDSEPGRYKSVTYRQFTNTHQVMIRAIDPSPCPSYKGVPEDHRLSHLERQRSGVDQVLAVQRLETVTDALIDASVPEVYKNAVIVSGGRLDRPRDLEPASAQRRPAACERSRRELGTRKKKRSGRSRPSLLRLLRPGRDHGERRPRQRRARARAWCGVLGSPP